MQLSYVIPFLHIRANMPPQVDSMIKETCFKMCLHNGCVYCVVCNVPEWPMLSNATQFPRAVGSPSPNIRKTIVVTAHTPTGYIPCLLVCEFLKAAGG